MKKMQEYFTPGETDSRVSGSVISPTTTIITAIVIILYSGILLSIYDNISFDPENSFYLAASILTLVIVVSVSIATFISYIHYTRFTKPMLYLAQAAREVAKGNYTIQLPTRTSKKTNEIDALFCDFNSMVRDLDSTEVLKSSFISNISHELKTPISVIHNYTTLISEDNITEDEKKEYIQKIQTTSEELSTLISNILQISKLDNHQLETVITNFNISETLIRCILGFELNLDQKNINLDLDIPDELNIRSDKGLMKIVINNVLSNAIKFVPMNGNIQISLSQVGNKTVLTVSDDGCGMDEDTKKHIFDKFYQGDSSHKTKGNGLGLSMVKQIITLLNGSIDVKSSPNMGSTFIISLPNQS